jgi:hypothetical protein
LYKPPMIDEGDCGAIGGMNIKWHPSWGKLIVFYYIIYHIHTFTSWCRLFTSKEANLLLELKVNFLVRLLSSHRGEYMDCNLLRCDDMSYLQKFQINVLLTSSEIWMPHLTSEKSVNISRITRCLIPESSFILLT